ncbi:hypothetical protein AJ87_14125 [Rhizobium yanglingense]|nr:hypothetical protein AJ87_14125 [Rhizobium yanglingense]
MIRPRLLNSKLVGTFRRDRGFLKWRTATAAELEAIATIGAPLNESEKGRREEALRLASGPGPHRTK